METVKEVILDLLILLAGLIIVSAEGVASHAGSVTKGLSCGQEQAQVRASTPEEALP